MTPVWATIQHAVILGLVNSQPGHCVTQEVHLAVQLIASWLRRRSYAESLGIIGVMPLSFVLAIRQPARRISPCQTVRIPPSFNPGVSSYLF